MLPTNIIRVCKTFHTAMGSNTAATGQPPELIIVPSTTSVEAVIHILELHMSTIEQAAKRGWTLNAAEALQVWNENLVVEDATLPLYEFDLIVLTSVDDWNKFPLCNWVVGGQAVTERAYGNSLLPAGLDPPFPQRTLPLDIFFVTAMALAQLYYLNPRPPIRPNFAMRINDRDYLLTLGECGTPSSWRQVRPHTLPFRPPPSTLFYHSPRM